MNNYTLIQSMRRKKTIYPRINLNFFRTLLFVLTCFLLCFYVFQTVDTINKNHFVWACEKDIINIAKENKNLEIKFFEGCSLENIEQLAKNINFEKVSEVDYINLSASQVAGK
ncbi:MAG: hypothetical protein U9P88_02470 [Patescibacteria group bacterium]|nr:hypothetical protein [Patescibacteria group bacterium]